MEFVLFEKLSELSGVELIMFIAAIAVVIAIIVVMAIRARKKNSADAEPSAAQEDEIVGTDAASYEAQESDIAAEEAEKSAVVQDGDIAAEETEKSAVVQDSETPAVKPVKHRLVRSDDATRAMVYGALCISLSFMLSYIKLFSMPMGGSITLCSMLPLALYAAWFGKARGFAAAFIYGILQVIQGPYIVHWAQFILDYFVAFTCIGIASFFPRRVWLGVLAGGMARFLVSTLSGVIFFSDATNGGPLWPSIVYSLGYNGSTIGIDAVLCTVVAALPPVAKLARVLGMKKTDQD